MNHTYRAWLQKHLEEALLEYNRIQELEEAVGTDEELYDRVLQMWGYLAALEKCLKELDAQSQGQASSGNPAAGDRH